VASDGPTLVVGYDGSDNAKAALAYVRKRLGGGRGRAVVVIAYAPDKSWFGAPSFQPVLTEAKQHGQSLADTIEEQELLGDVPHEMELVEESPPEALVEAASKHDADDIVVGTRGVYPLRSGLGSVCNTLLQIADRPVVVIPPGARSK
jgi:nucleotide-binding universal stress UspA family protein